MLSFYNIWTIAKFELKTLSRSWFFRIFGTMSILALIFYNLVIFTDVFGAFIPREMYGMSSSIPYFNLLMFNLAQGVIAVFLASDFLKRDKKLDTTEAIYIRSMTNFDYVIGKTIGILSIFMFLNLMVVLVSIVFQLIADGANFDPIVYFYYLFLITIPTLIFIVGLAFFLMTIIRNQALTFLVVTAYIGTTLFYLGGKFYFVFDYIGFYIPLMHSDFIGLGNTSELILLRGAYLLVGIAFIFFTTVAFNRLTQSKAMDRVSSVIAGVCALAGFVLLFTYVNQIYSGQDLRREMISLNQKHSQKVFPTITNTKLDLEHKSNLIEVTADLSLLNTTQNIISELVFNLNPGLKVSEVLYDQSKIQFTRDLHLLKIKPNNPVTIGSQHTLSIKYAGNINEEACYLDISEDEREESKRNGVISISKRYGVILPNYLMLTAETMWYPSIGTTYTPENQFNRNIQFQNFELAVNTNPALTVITQGEETEGSNGVKSYKSLIPLPKLSLTIGEYEKRSIEVDSIKYNLFYHANHNYFDEFMAEIGDTVHALIKELKQDYERELNLEYPYSEYSLVEAPIQFTAYERFWTTAQEISQPQIVYLPEQAFDIREADFRMSQRSRERFGNRSNQVELPKEIESKNFKKFVKAILLDGEGSFRFRRSDEEVTVPENPYSIFPNYFSHTNYFSSQDLPVLNRMLENYLKNEKTAGNPTFERMFWGLTNIESGVQKLGENSLKETISDTSFRPYLRDILKIKGTYIFTYLEYSIGAENLRKLLNEILTQNKFTDKGYNIFISRLLSDYQIDLETVLKKWFTETELPGYYVTGVEYYKVIDDERERFQVNFKITNSTEIEGFVKIKFEPTSGNRRRGFFSFFSNNEKPEPLKEKIIHLTSKQTKKISTILDDEPNQIVLNTLLSKNLPLEQYIGFTEFELNKRRDADDSEETLDKMELFQESYEIIVDNVDEGFNVLSEKTESYLKKLLNLSGEGRKYEGVRFWDTPDNWAETIMSNAYGEHIKSAHYMEAGEGLKKVEWNTVLDRSGYYEVMFFVTKPATQGRRRSQMLEDYSFVINHDDGSDEVTLDVAEADAGWASLGSYYLSADSAKVELSDKSNGSMIFADAIKWVKQK